MNKIKSNDVKKEKNISIKDKMDKKKNNNNNNNNNN